MPAAFAPAGALPPAAAAHIFEPPAPPTVSLPCPRARACLCLENPNNNNDKNLQTSSPRRSRPPRRAPTTSAWSRSGRRATTAGVAGGDAWAMAVMVAMVMAVMMGGGEGAGASGWLRLEAGAV